MREQHIGVWFSTTENKQHHKAIVVSTMTDSFGPHLGRFITIVVAFLHLNADVDFKCFAKNITTKYTVHTGKKKLQAKGS